MKISIKLPWQAYWAEFLGTFIFVFISCGAVLTNQFSNDLGEVGVAIASGMIYMAMVYSTVGISGGHLNPAVTLAMWFAEKISAINAIFYICFQLIASISASCLLLWVFGQKSIQFLLGGTNFRGRRVGTDCDWTGSYNEWHSSFCRFCDFS